MNNLISETNNQQDNLTICKKIIAVLIKSHGFRCSELCKHYELMQLTLFGCPYLAKNKDVFVCVEAVIETAKENKEMLDKAVEYYRTVQW